MAYTLILSGCYGSIQPFFATIDDLRIRVKLHPAPVLTEFEHSVPYPGAFLQTGWYYVADSLTEFSRTLPRQKDTAYCLHNEPIVTIQNFSKIRLYESRFGNFIGLSIKFNKQGKEAWRIATDNAINRHLGLIIQNVLITTPYVNSSISSGFSAINSTDYSPEEMLMFKRLLRREIELEKNHKK